MTLKEIQERLVKWFKKGIVYNISEGKQFTVKEQRVSTKVTIKDIITEMRTTNKQVMKAIMALNTHFDHLFEDNPTLIKRK